MAGRRKKFGETIRALREKKKLTDPEFSLRRFAQAIGVSATYLSKVETDEFPPPSEDKVKKIAELLGEDPDELLALAGKVDSELPEIIREQPKAVADFLRTAKEAGLTAEDFEKLTEKLKKKR